MSARPRLGAALAAITALTALGLSACSGPAASTTSTPPPSSSAPATPSNAAPPTLRGYEFPGGMIEGLQGGGQVYTRVEGLLALPGGTGRHPVVVVMHGSYPSCIDVGRDKLLTAEVQTVPWPEGCGTERASQEDGLTSGPDYVRTPASLAYLARSLAERGFAVVIPDANSKERLDWGGEPDARALQTKLAKLHLDLARRLDAGDALGLSWGGDVKGRLDTSRVALVGHSSGAGYAVEAALGGDLPGLKAAVALEPAIKSIPDAAKPGAPLLAILGQCDEQIPLTDNQSEMRDIVKANPTSPFVSVVLEHATHIDMLTGGGSHTIGLVTPQDSPACAPSALLRPALQRSAAAQLVGDFLEQALAGSTSFRLSTVTGSSASVGETSQVSATIAPTTAMPPAVDPHSIVYTSSTVAVLAPKPASLRLHGGPGDGHL